MGPAQLLQHIVPVALHAQGHAVEALGPELFQQGGGHGVGVGLKGDLGVLVDPEPVLQLGEDPAQTVGAEEGRGAAAEIDGVHDIVRRQGPGLLEVDRQGLHEIVHQPFVPAPADGVEVAVLALAPAEGDVDVYSQRFQFVHSIHSDFVKVKSE